ncbi:MAG TPA: sigma-70 family RNA polymerase sigma factor, partial [Urbifossiella sp.]|nr:sigma-70 family RNA polymerase sigma factor [Urbifossiella sp.]
MSTARLPAVVRATLRADPDAAGPDADLLARFVAARDEAAFAALVRRHGATVWDVCRSVLGNRADADDAFQAVFLVLSRRAAQLRQPASLGAWLHGVSVRVARKARAAAARRQVREAKAPPPGAADPPDPSWAEVRAVVHEALAALPAAYREPLIACYLRGLTRDAAAAELGLSPATVKKRLERGRNALRALLIRRGLGPAVLLAFGSVPATAAPATLLAAAPRLVAAGAGPIPRSVLRLVEGGISMSVVKLVAGAVLVSAVGFALAGTPADPAPQKEGQPPRFGGAGVKPPPVAPPDPTGEWKVLTVETNGQPLLTPAGLRTARVVFTAGKAELTGFQLGVVGNFAFKLDPTTSPKSIDITPADGPLRGKTLAGVYAVPGPNELRLCVRLDNAELGRPKGFVTTGEPGLYTLILQPVKRVAPPTGGGGGGGPGGGGGAGGGVEKGVTARLVIRDPDTIRSTKVYTPYIEFGSPSGAVAAITLEPRDVRLKITDANGQPVAESAVAPAGQPLPLPAAFSGGAGSIPAGGYLGIPLPWRRGFAMPENGAVLVAGWQDWVLPPGRYTAAGVVNANLLTGPGDTDPRTRPAPRRLRL